MTEIIDEAWRADKLTDLDIVVSNSTLKSKLSVLDPNDPEQQQRIPISEQRTWNDYGMAELISPLTADLFQNEDPVFQSGPNIRHIR